MTWLPGWADRLLARGGDAWIAVAALANVLGFFRDPSRNPIHAVAAPWDSLWAVMYGIGGLLLLVAFALKRPTANIEAGGWALIAAGAIVQVVVFASFGVGSLSGTWATVTILALLVVIAVYRILSIRRAGKVTDARDHP